jgi:hypothetical protein
MNKTRLWAASVALLIIIPALYLVSPFSKSNRSLRVFVNRETSAPMLGGYRASVVNEGLLPVFVDTCDFVEDSMARVIVIPDVIQRFGAESGAWSTALERRGCYEPPEGTHEKKLTPKLLWPRQTISSTYFFPNVGFPGFPFKHGDKFRFLVFTGIPAHGSEALTSREFTID